MFSIVIPLYKCENSLNELNQRLCHVLEMISSEFEILYIIDGSPEDEWSKVIDLAKKDPRIKGLNLSRNFGQHYAISAGLENAKGEWIIVMDGDLQDVPEEIPRLVTRAREGFDIVLAQRKVRNDRLFKKLYSIFFYKFLSWLTGFKYDHTIANFGIYKRNVIDSILSMGDSIRFFPSMIKWVGYKKSSLIVEHSKRSESHSSYNFGKSMRLALDIILSYSDKPIRIVIKAGIIISFSAFSFAIYVFIEALKNKIEVPGYASIIISIWFFSGLIIAIIGVVGLYVSKTFQTVKRRPIFIVSDRINI